MFIETQRLILRAFVPADAKDVFEYLKAPEVDCFMSMKLESVEKAKNAVLERIEDPENHIAIYQKESGRVIGEIELYADGEDKSSDSEDFSDTFSPGWMLNRDFQGKGYAFEAVHAFFDYLFKHRGARRIYAYTAEDNYPSRHLCEKLGIRREGVFLEYVSFVKNKDGTPKYENTVQYAILKKEWKG